jgi:hypothetical protein
LWVPPFSARVSFRDRVRAWDRDRVRARARVRVRSRVRVRARARVRVRARIRVRLGFEGLRSSAKGFLKIIDIFRTKKGIYAIMSCSFLVFQSNNQDSA